jgi:hypothetical protein
MRRELLFFLIVVGPWSHLFASGCATGTPIATFTVKVFPAKVGPPIPLSTINIVSPGQKLRYEPVKLPEDLRNTARVSVIIVPVSDTEAKQFKVLGAQPAKEAAEWSIPQTASAIGLIFGSYGIDTKKVTSLIQKHPEIVTKLADYAEQSTRVEALVQTLSQYEKSPPTGKSLQSVLQGFSSQYGVQLPSLDNKTALSQQVLSVLKTIAPTVAGEDPLHSRGNAVVKAGGLAESVAVSYFGAPVALTIGGATLFQSLHSSLFPPTHFRAAFAQPAAPDATNLCSAKAEDKETRSHIDYIWLSRIPNLEPPNVSLIADAHIPLGMPSKITVSAATVAQLESLSRARNWRLVSATDDATPIPAKLTTASSSDTITLDLSKTSLVPGEYRLAADWDWTPFKINGKVQVHALGNIANAQLTADSRDALISGTASVQVQLEGTDFEFVDSISLIKPGRLQNAPVLPFILPKGNQQGEQRSIQVEIDTAALSPGPYSLAIRQVNGVTAAVPVTLHPPNPELTQIPLNVNVGEPKQSIILHGRHLERIEKITSHRAQWILGPSPKGAADLTERTATLRLASTVQKGDQLNAEILVSGLEKPLKVDGMARVVGPRPKITGAERSLAGEAGIELHDGEIPADAAVSFALREQSVDSHPRVELACSSESDTRRKISIGPGDKTDSAELDVTGESSLFLSIEPSMIGDSGCQLSVSIVETETGTSEPFILGRLIRLPHIDGFTVTDQKIGDSSYAASLTGRDLQLIEKAGWDTDSGEPVAGIPTPVSGSPREQTLKINISWPPPSPKAPLYIWLRGENGARRTSARYP